jgi:hypothetical protein
MKISSESPKGNKVEIEMRQKKGNTMKLVQ